MHVNKEDQAELDQFGDGVARRKAGAATIDNALDGLAIEPNSLQCACALSLFVSSAQSAASRNTAARLEYVLASASLPVRKKLITPASICPSNSDVTAI